MKSASVTPSALRICPAGLLLVLLGCVGLVRADDPEGFSVREAVRLSWETERGTLCQVFASTDLLAWQKSGMPVFGTGGRVELLLSGDPDGEGCQFYRLRTESEPVGGLAPWELTTQSLVLNDGAVPARYDFQENGEGVWKAGEVLRVFSWIWQRSGLNDGLVTITWGEGIREDLKLIYTGPRLGRFERNIYEEGGLEYSSAGTFGSLPADGAPLLPVALSGRCMVFTDGATGTSLELDSANTGTRVLEGEPQAVTYFWLITGSTSVTLNTSVSATHGEEYKLTFTGPQNGTFVRSTFTEGTFRDEDSGVFTLSDPPETP